MKKLLKHGRYTLFETKQKTRILNLDDEKCFAWIRAKRIGEILAKSRKINKFANILSTGQYKLYEVEDEPKLVDLQHLELEIGNNRWQGYLLTNGLPTSKKKRHRIIPTDELVSV